MDATNVNTIALPCATFLALYPLDREIVDNEMKVITTLSSICAALLGSVIDSTNATLSNKRALAFTALSIATFTSMKQLYDNYRKFSNFGISCTLRFCKTSFCLSLGTQNQDVHPKQ